MLEPFTIATGKRSTVLPCSRSITPVRARSIFVGVANLVPTFKRMVSCSFRDKHYVNFYLRFVRELLVVSLAISSNCVYCASKSSEEEDIAI